MRLSLKYLILSIALLSIILTMASSFSSGYKVSRDTLIHTALETNEAYAQKLSSSTESYIKMTLQSLNVSAERLSAHMSNEDAVTHLIPEANRIREQANTFNSVVIVNADGEILATSPQTLELVGNQLNSTGGKQALKERQAFISQPYTAITGRLIIFISQPIFHKDGTYLGLVGGTIYLKEENILQEVLGEHFYKDGSYVFVVDNNGKIIYHENPKRVNDNVSENPVVQELLEGKSGSMEVTNTKNVDMLAGYATIPVTGWGVISQKAKSAVVAPSASMTKEMILKTIPLLLISSIFLWYLTKSIAQPLQKMAQYTEDSTNDSSIHNIHELRAWYYEARQLKIALIHSLNFFQDQVRFYSLQSTIDPLTGLWNRRMMDDYLRAWTKEETPYAVVLIDIDKFKRINDTYGHSVGDEVLRFLADEMRKVARPEDKCCRYGGEEFILLLPESDNEMAGQIAEQLRKKMGQTISPCGEIITFSAGVAGYPTNGDHPQNIIEIADKCLYTAKQNGRNRVVSPV